MGIYANGAGYENHFAFMPDADARKLTAVPQPYFDLYRVYLGERREADAFARELDSYLSKENALLMAESYREASPFFTNNSRNLRMMFNIFLLFVLAVIAVGLMSTVRMNLFDRMKEFGTLRAIGYSRFRSYGIVFAEMFLLAAMALVFALVCTVVILSILGQTGIYVGTGPVSYGVGGERFWPQLLVDDIVLAFIAIMLFSLAATLGPGLKLCYQSITDMLLKQQRRFSLPKAIIKEWRAGNQR